MADEDYQKLPLEQRLTHKAWKCRLEAYEETVKLCRANDDPKSNFFAQFVPLADKMVTDSNAAAQEKGVEAVLAFAEFGAEFAKQVTREVVGGIVKKCMNARAGTKAKAQDVCLMFIEIDKADPVVTELMAGFGDKQPKIVCGCLETITRAVSEFGVKGMACKPIMQALPVLWSHSDATVRKEAKSLTVEFYRWFGPLVKTHLDKLRDVQMKELDEEISRIGSEKAKPTRFLRSEQERMAAAPAKANASGDDDHQPSAQASEDGGADIDPLDLIDAVNVLAKLPNNFYENLESTKWSSRKEALEALEAILSPKIESGDYSELVRVLKKALGDSNVVVVALAAKCIRGLACGLRKEFSQYIPTVLGPLLGKFKEKKQNVVLALRDAVDAVYSSAPDLAGLVEDATAAMADKNPAVKQETLLWMHRSISRSKVSQLPASSVKPLNAAFVKNLDDPAPEVREAAMQALGAVLGIIGERPMVSYMDSMDKLKAAKVREFAALVTAAAPASSTTASASASSQSIAKSKPVSSVPAPPASASTAKAVAKKSVEESGESSTAMKKPAMPVAVAAAAVSSRAKSVAASSSTKGKATSTKGSKSSGAATDDSALPNPLSPEEVDEQAPLLFGNAIIEQLGSANWKDRLAGCEALQQYIEATDPATLNSEVVTRFLSKKPSWKEVNFQVISAAFNACASAATRADSFNRRHASYVVPGCVDKLPDMKIKVSAQNALTAFAQASSLEAIASQVSKAASGHKNPKATAGALEWLSQAVIEFGPRVNVKEMIAFIKESFASTAPAVRTAAIQLLATIRVFIGPPIRELFNDEKAALLALIDAGIEKRVAEPVPAPIRTLKSDVVAQTAEEGDDDEASADGTGNAVSARARRGADPMDDILPRVDISGRISSSLLSELDDANWKVRGEGLEKVASLLKEASGRIGPDLGDLPTSLKRRLEDSNKNHVSTALVLCGQLATASGPAFERHLLTFLPGVLSALSDNKATLRTTALETLDKFVEQVGLSIMFTSEAILKALSVENPTLRSTLYTWLEAKLTALGASVKSVEGIDTIIKPILASLEDRSPDVRKAAQAILPPVIVACTYNGVIKRTSALKPTSKSTVLAILEKVKNSTPAAAASSVQPAKAPVAGKPTPATTTAASTTASAPAASAAPVTALASKLNKLAKPASASVSKSSGDLDDEQPALIENAEKSVRASNDSKKLKWQFDVPRQEFVDLLKAEMSPCVGKGVFAQLFHEDFKKQVSGLQAILDMGSVVDGDGQYVNAVQLMGASDVLLKYCSLRFYDTNTSVLLKVIELLHLLFTVLASASYHLSEYEASAFLPHLVIKSGEPKDTVRKDIRSLFRTITQVYPASKLFVYLMTGIKSKNSRVRCECLEELGNLLSRHGIDVVSPGALKEIAKNVGERDNSVRTAALNALVAAHAVLGDNLYKQVGDIPAKDRDMIEDRVKRAGTTAPTASAANCSTAPPATAAPVSTSMKRTPTDVASATHQTPQKAASATASGTFSLDLDKFGLAPVSVAKTLPTLAPTNVAELTGMENLSAPTPRLPTKHHIRNEKFVASANPIAIGKSSLMAAAGRSEIELLDLVLREISSNDVSVSTQSLKQVEAHLKEDERADALVSWVDRILVATTEQFHLAFTEHLKNSSKSREEVIRLCKHVLNTLMLLFKRQALAKVATRPVLQRLITELISRLLDSNLTEFEEGSQITRILNILMLRVLENSNRNSCFGALIDSLSSCVSDESNAKHVELVMKCLWKLTKAMPTDIALLSVPDLVRDCDSFLTEHPPSSWKENDLPLRTIKTIIQNLVTIVGRSLVALVNGATGPDSMVRAYVDSYLDNKSTPSRGRPTSVLTVNTPNHANSATLPSTPKTPMLSREVLAAAAATPSNSKEKLTAIFKKIGSKADTQLGLEELYDFKLEHPSVDVTPFLSKTSTFFQDYIERNLLQIGERRAGSRPIAVAGSITSAPAPSVFTSETAAPTDYRDRLKMLQSRYGIQESTDAVKATPAVPMTLVPDVPPTEAAVEKSAAVGPAREETTRQSTAETEDAVALLKARLNRIKTATRT